MVAASSFVCASLCFIAFAAGAAVRGLWQQAMYNIVRRRLHNNLRTVEVYEFHTILANAGGFAGVSRWTSPSTLGFC